MESEDFMARLRAWRKWWAELEPAERELRTREIIIRNVVDSFAFEGDTVDPQFLRENY